MDCQLIVATAGSNGSMSKPQQQLCAASSQSTPELKLTVVSVETKDDVELVQCQLETAKHSSVSFKFNHRTEQPSDVAVSLVSQITLVPIHTRTHSFFVNSPTADKR